MRNTLHVYGQQYPHDDVYIAGDKRAILALIDACEDALYKTSSNFETYASDGEAYDVHVIVKSPEQMENFTPRYTGENEVPNTETPHYPWDNK